MTDSQQMPPAPAPDQPPQPGAMSKILGWVKRHKIWSTVSAVLVVLTVIAAFTPDSTTDESATDTSTDSGAGCTAKWVVG